MVGILDLWLPILLSAVFAFVASSVIHMALQYHRSDWKGVPDEDGVLDALRSFNIPPGDYAVPHAGSPEALKSEEFREKANKGPVLFMTVFPSGDPFAMGTQLFQWFLYCTLVGVFTAYLVGLALGPGPDMYRPVFRMASCTAFVGYSLAHLQRSIWYKQSWSTTMKNVFDGLIYGLLTGGTFGWLWPEM